MNDGSIDDRLTADLQPAGGQIYPDPLNELFADLAASSRCGNLQIIV